MSEELCVTLPVRLSAVHDLAAMVEEFGDANQLPVQKIFVVNLVLDELITNAVTHGSFTGVADPKIEIWLKVDHDAVILTMEDNGRMFDPTMDTEPDTDSSLDEREVGGLGLYLVKTFASRILYEFTGNKNRLTLEHDLKPASK